MKLLILRVHYFWFSTVCAVKRDFVHITKEQRGIVLPVGKGLYLPSISFMLISFLPSFSESVNIYQIVMCWIFDGFLKPDS